MWLALTLALITADGAQSSGAKGASRGGLAQEARPAPMSWSNDSVTISNLGHSTLLGNFLGIRWISDPVFSERVGLSLDHLITIGPRRHGAPPLRPDQLPPLDLILISHAHMDHLDLPSLRALPKSAVVVACERCADLLEPLGFKEVRQLSWGESTEVGGMKITAMGARHWGRRWPWGPDRGYNSYILEKDSVRMLLACDSAVTDIFARLGRNPPEVAAFSIGAYDPWILNHANPEQVWEMFRQTGARYLIPIHWGTFRLSKEPMDEPLRRLLAVAGTEADRIVLREIGATWVMPARSAAVAAAR